MKRLRIPAIVAAATMLAVSAQAQIVSFDGTNTTFNVSGGVDETLTHAAPIVAGGFVIVLFGIGVRLIMRQVKRIRG